MVSNGNGGGAGGGLGGGGEGGGGGEDGGGEGNGGGSMNVLSYTCHSTADELSLTMCPNLAFTVVCNPATKELWPSSTVAILYLLSEDG